MTYPRFLSTRGGGRRVSFSDALLQGLAPDGGLYIPDHVPEIREEEWLSNWEYKDVASHILYQWLGDELSPDEVGSLSTDAFTFDVPVVSLPGERWSRIHILELFHGPTLSFKDFGARTMARLMSHFLRSRDEELTILVATSGDTGSAVADGFAGQDQIRVVLLYPRGQVSPVQERQLIVRRPGVRSFAVEGTFDDCQSMVKQAFVDPDLSHRLLSSANSINIGRLVPQSIYYIWASFLLGMNEVVFSVPSGNLGDLTGGVLAWMGGLRVRQFLAAHNANDFFPRFLEGGDDEYRESIRTLSNAMDVGVPSNYERLRGLLPADELRRMIQGFSISDAETLQLMRQLHEETGYVTDPHTAVGLEAARRYYKQQGKHLPVIILSTAHPAKFPETVKEALGFEPDTPKRLERLWNSPVRVESLAPTVEALKEQLLKYPVEH